jgi:uncharacterized protein (DUF427 family)
MGLTTGTGPFSSSPTVELNFGVAPPMLAESVHAVGLFEIGLPPRRYFRDEDVRTELLEPSGKKTRCAD